jgi:hypothetical protein
MSIEQDGTNLTRVRNGTFAQTFQWSRSWSNNSVHESGSLRWRTISGQHFAVVTAVRAGFAAEPGLLIEHPVVKTLAQLGDPVPAGIRTFISDSIKNFEDDGGTGVPYAFGSIAKGGGSYAAPVHSDGDFWRYG